MIAFRITDLDGTELTRVDGVSDIRPYLRQYAHGAIMLHGTYACDDNGALARIYDQEWEAKMTTTRQLLCAGNYRYMTPLGGFALDRRTDGWHLTRYSQHTGTMEFGVFPTLVDADSAVQRYVREQRW